MLDVLRTADAVCGLEPVDCGALQLGWCRPTECEDELTLAARIRAEGWVRRPQRGQIVAAPIPHT